MRVNTLLGVSLGALLVVQVWAIEEDTLVEGIDYLEGVDYTKLAEPQPTESGEKIEVLEVFMYSCPHCFYLEPTLEKWLTTKPENVEFKRMPALFSAQVIPQAKAYYAAELIGKGKQFHLPLLRALHEDGQAIWDEDALVAFAAAQGIDGKEFRNAFNSFDADMRVRRAAEMRERFSIDSVPTIIVNGKYRTSPSQTGGRERMIQVIDHLIGIETDQPATEEAPTEAAPTEETSPATSDDS